MAGGTEWLVAGGRWLVAQRLPATSPKVTNYQPQSYRLLTKKLSATSYQPKSYQPPARKPPMAWDSLTGKTTIVGLIGWPVSHSVSPPMHNAAFAALGLDWRFVPLPVAVEPPERIGEA